MLYRPASRALSALGFAFALMILQPTAKADVFTITSTLGTGTFTTADTCNESQQVDCTLTSFSFPFVYGQSVTLAGAPPAPATPSFSFSDGVGGPDLNASVSFSCVYGACWYYFGISSPGSTGTAHEIYEADGWAGHAWDDPNVTITDTSNPVSATPEPMSVALLSTELAALALLLRRFLLNRG